MTWVTGRKRRQGGADGLGQDLCHGQEDGVYRGLSLGRLLLCGAVPALRGEPSDRLQVAGPLRGGGTGGVGLPPPGAARSGQSAARGGGRGGGYAAGRTFCLWPGEGAGRAGEGTGVAQRDGKEGRGGARGGGG